MSNRRQRGKEAVVSMSDRRNAEPVEDALPVGNGRKQPVEVIPVDALGEESSHPQEVTGLRAVIAEGWRGEVEFYGCR